MILLRAWEERRFRPGQRGIARILPEKFADGIA
jgi:hypothetical protein